MSSVIARLAHQEEVQKTTNDQLAAIVAALSASTGNSQPLRRHLFNTNPPTPAEARTTNPVDPTLQLAETLAADRQPRSPRSIRQRDLPGPHQGSLNRANSTTTSTNDKTPGSSDLRVELNAKRTKHSLSPGSSLATTDGNPIVDLRDQLNARGSDLRAKLDHKKA
ncbi:hypothetical protein IGI04_036042, partial [Brassica rapa subsp. trilocularis]